MNIFWGIIILTHIASLTFLGLAVLKYFAYKKRNNIIENRYTLLFGFIRLEHVIITYIAFVLAYTFGSTLLVYYLSTL